MTHMRTNPLLLECRRASRPSNVMTRGVLAVRTASRRCCTACILRFDLALRRAQAAVSVCGLRLFCAALAMLGPEGQMRSYTSNEGIYTNLGAYDLAYSTLDARCKRVSHPGIARSENVRRTACTRSSLTCQDVWCVRRHVQSRRCSSSAASPWWRCPSTKIKASRGVAWTAK